MATTGAIRAGRAFVEIFADNSKLKRGLRAARAQVNAFGQHVRQVGMQMMQVALVGAIPLAASTKVFAGFDDQMRAVAAVTGRAGAEFDRLTDKAKLLGRTTSFTAAQVAGGMLNLARAGFNPQEIDAAIAGMLDLARATGTDLAVSADIAAGTLRAFEMQAREMPRVADVLTATANNSAQTLEDLGESMKYAAPIAREYGLNVEQTSMALGVLANMQIKGSMAGTSLRQIMLSLADPAIQKRLRQLGVEALDVNGNLRPLGPLMIELGQAMAKMTSAERLKIGADLFGLRAASAAVKLVKSDFPGLQKAIEDSAGAAAKTAETMDSGIGGAARRMLSAVEGVAIAVGESLAGALSKAADAVSEIAGRITAWVEANKAVVVTVLKLVAAVGAVGAGLVAFSAAVTVVGWVLGSLMTVVGAVHAVLSAVGVVLGALLTPLGAVIAGVVALGGAIAYWTGAGSAAVDWLGGRFDQLKAVVGQVVDAISAALQRGDVSAAANVLWASLKLAWQRGASALTGLWIDMKFTVVRVFDDLAFSILRAWDGLSAKVQQIWITMTTGLRKVGAKLSSWYGQMIEGIANRLAKIAIDVQAKLDPTLDADAAKQSINQQSKQERDAITAQERKQLDAIDRERMKRLDALGDEEAKRELARLTAENESKRQRDAQQQKASAENERALTKARAELDEAIQRARQSPGDAPTDDPAGRARERARRVAPEVEGVNRQITGAADVVGSFRAFRLPQMGSDSTAERTASASEQTAKNTRDLLDRADDGGLVFT